jgi:gluconolactonase
MGMGEAYEIADPRFARLVLPNAALEVLADGCAWTEGPVWFADHDMLLFSDSPNDRVMRWTAGGVTVARAPAGFANGHARDGLGRLISCSHQHRRVERREADGRMTILADRYEGRRLNAPNDVVVQSDGSIWFTDPHYGINTDYEGGKQVAERPACVYRLGAQGGLSVVADDFAGPNGLCFSPDERRLYIAETGEQFVADAPKYVRAFDVEGAQLSGGVEFLRVSPGNVDGFCADVDGNLWCSGGDRVHCFSAAGERLGAIITGDTVSNLAFGGRHRCRLFITGGTRLRAIYTNTRGAQRP